MDRFMEACLDQARLAQGHCRPNPAVGAVIVDIKGQILGVGHTQSPGQPHAEIMALRDAMEKGNVVKGATIYVTLEPCSHHGRTGPCTEALISAGVKRVIASIKDPNPLVSGRGFEKLRAAGIEIQVGQGAAESAEINKGFLSRMIRKRPWVRMKVAASLDGKTALENGTSQWITSENARQDGHVWRSRSCAILTGIGTVLDDNPSLNVRLNQGNTHYQPVLVVVDSKLQTPVNANIFNTDRSVLIYTTSTDSDKSTKLENAGARVITQAENSNSTLNKVDLTLMMEDLAGRGFNELHVEAGQKLNGSLLKANLVDEMLVYLAPMMIGLGLPMANIGPFETLGEIERVTFMSVDLIGPDIRVIAKIDQGEWLASAKLQEYS